MIQEVVDRGLLSDYVFMSFQGIEYCKIISKECVDYFTDNVVQHPCIPLYNATCIANPNTMIKMVLNERIREIVAPLNYYHHP